LRTMKKLLSILGLVLLLAGGITLLRGYVDEQSRLKQTNAGKLKNGSLRQDFLNRYTRWMQLPEQVRIQSFLWADANGVPKTNEQIIVEQQQRLNADIEKLASENSGVEVGDYADYLYGSGWKQKVDEYKRKQEKADFVFNCAVICTSLGGVIIVVMVFLQLGKFISRIKNKQSIPKQETVIRNGYAKRIVTDESGNQGRSFRSLGRQNRTEDFLGIMGQLSDKLECSPLKSSTSTTAVITDPQKDCSSPEVAVTSETNVTKDETERYARKKIKPRHAQSHQTKEQTPSVPTDERKNAPSPQTDTVKHEDDSHKPLNHTLMELTQQVSAIREYAANQQNRLNRFQDGYDWNIIKNFCLRIIRCIDNLEYRIADLTEQDQDVSEFEQIRDELIFAMESSGVERFEPELNSDYKGQEKFTEALKDKCICEDSNMKGKIEKIIRPGYQCHIDEQNIRVVRPAQVRLYA
jgi:molecular chaperone GrpE (heat shock protein)